ncbi:MAG: TIGR03936 family radical SAM-associated protein [Pseudonocardia sp.]
MARLRPGTAANPAPPTVQRIRLRFAKRGRLRFLSHRDVARCFERAVRRAGVPVAHSHGFSPHPRLSWIGAAPTCSASEAEYVEIGLTHPLDPGELALALDAALPDGLDVLAAAVGEGAPLAERIDASRWSVELPGLDADAVRAAGAALWARESLIVERVIPSGRRRIDVRTALVRLDVHNAADLGARNTADTGNDNPDMPPASARMTEQSAVCAILTVVVRQTTPAVRPDDVLSALDVVAGLRPPVPPKATRMAQGLLDDRGDLADPLGSDRVTTRV